jgi:glycosyltransferase involved in cell wall biosynthesis
MVFNEPLVSIGLPVYNAEKYLEEALESILDQTYKHFELIVSDNASNDRTQDICLKYAQKDSRVRYYRNETNLGAAPNHNHVFELAKGKYFKWAGYDDKIAPDFLSKCVEVLEKNLDIVLCMPQTGMIDENGQHIGGFDFNVDADISSPHMRFKNLMLKNKSGNFIYGLMRLDSVSKTSLHGSYPSSDLVFIAELAFYGVFYVMPERLFYRRMHAEQSTKGTLRFERNRVAWFDTSLNERIVLPKWRYLFGSLKAVKNAPLNVFQRLFCYMQVVRWALGRPQIRALGKDVLLVAKKLTMKLRNPIDQQKIQC